MYCSTANHPKAACATGTAHQIAFSCSWSGALSLTSIPANKAATSSHYSGADSALGGAKCAAWRTTVASPPIENSFERGMRCASLAAIADCTHCIYGIAAAAATSVADWPSSSCCIRRAAFGPDHQEVSTCAKLLLEIADQCSSTLMPIGIPAWALLCKADWL
jgi:hypothetical protein